MRIGIDCRTILHPEKGEGAGIGHYIYQLTRHLLKIDKKNVYFLFFDHSVQKRRLAKFKQKNVFIRFIPFVQYKQLMPSGFSHLLVNAALDREKLDVFHSPTLSLPRSYQGQSVLTVHDLAIYKFPELVYPSNPLFLKKIIPNMLREAKKIITVSNSTAKDLSEFFDFTRKKIHVIFHGLDQRFFRKGSLAGVKKIRKKYGINKSYLLFLGTLEPKKNVIRIIEAYERFRDGLVKVPPGLNGIKSGKVFFKYQLVLAGFKGFKFQKIKRKISQSEYKKDIILPGYIKADDLGHLFSGAKLFLFPSIYEGFGLPIPEALAKGVPVITSNISSMPEVAGDAAILVDPYNVAEIAQAVYNLLIDKDLQKRLKQRGQKQARRFSWEKCAKETLKVYEQTGKV